MRLLFTHEQHTVLVSGETFTKGLIGYAAMQNYLTHFSSGFLIVRQQPDEVSSPSENWLMVSGPGIEIAAIPDIQSFMSMLIHLPRILRVVQQASGKVDRFLIRMPGVVGIAVGVSLILLRKSFAVEFVGHPTESLRELYIKRGKSSGLMLNLLEFMNRFLIERAVAVAYRSDYLRRAFPSRKRETEFVISGAQIFQEVIKSSLPAEHFMARPFIFVSVGRINPEKGHKMLLEAFSKVKELCSAPVRLRIIGDGIDLPILKQQVVELGLDGHCELLGRIEWGKALFSYLDDCHLFLLPSLTEGMPRSLIEAMARGMPALGSRCGGIPELLPDSYLVAPNDVQAWAEAMIKLVNDPDELHEMSVVSFERSKEHWPRQLEKKKNAFWAKVMKNAK